MWGETPPPLPLHAHTVVQAETPETEGDTVGNLIQSSLPLLGTPGLCPVSGTPQSKSAAVLRHPFFTLL